MVNSNLWIRKTFREFRQKFKCENCGGQPVEFAHLEETEICGNKRWRGRKERYYDVRKNPDKYTALCPKCHDDYDAGRLQIKPRTIKDLSG